MADGDTIIGFNPCFKWICFLIKEMNEALKILNNGFNPCFKWICFLIKEMNEALKILNNGFNPCFKWICFLISYKEVQRKCGRRVLILVLNG